MARRPDFWKFKGASAGNFMARRPDLRSVALREGLGRPREGSVRVGFGTTARHSRVAFARVPARPHLQPGGRAVCWFCEDSSGMVNRDSVVMVNRETFVVVNRNSQLRVNRLFASTDDLRERVALRVAS